MCLKKIIELSVLCGLIGKIQGSNTVDINVLASWPEGTLNVQASGQCIIPVDAFIPANAGHIVLNFGVRVEELSVSSVSTVLVDPELHWYVVRLDYGGFPPEVDIVFQYIYNKDLQPDGSCTLLPDTVDVNQYLTAAGLLTASSSAATTSTTPTTTATITTAAGGGGPATTGARKYAGYSMKPVFSGRLTMFQSLWQQIAPNILECGRTCQRDAFCQSFFYQSTEKTCYGHPVVYTDTAGMEVVNDSHYYIMF